LNVGANMARLINSLRDWGLPEFSQTLKSEIASLGPSTLPLDKAISPGSHVDDSQLSATVLNAADAGDAIQAKVGIFFTEIVASCGCGDEPMPKPAYCEMRITIDKATADAIFAIVFD
jgi:hypothetical protein